MLAPLATLAFLAAIWLLARITLDMIDESGMKVVAALGGRSMLAEPTLSRPISVRFQPRAGSVRRPVHAQPAWRAAA